MNTLKGIITKIETSESLSLVEIKVGPILLKSIVIETSATAPYLRNGNGIHVIFKETEVVIGKGINHQVSLQNKITGTILKIERGGLLSKLTIETSVGKIKSIITSNAVEQLQLRVEEEITAMIKTNEIMLSE